MKQFDPDIYDNLSEEVFEGDDFLEITSEKIYEQGRWKTYLSQVFQYKLDNTFWEASWARGSTEYQEDDDDDFSLVQVSPKEVTTTIYEMVE